MPTFRYTLHHYQGSTSFFFFINEVLKECTTQKNPVHFEYLDTITLRQSNPKETRRLSVIYSSPKTKSCVILKFIFNVNVTFIEVPQMKVRRLKIDEQWKTTLFNLRLKMGKKEFFSKKNVFRRSKYFKEPGWVHPNKDGLWYCLVPGLLRF